MAAAQATAEEAPKKKGSLIVQVGLLLLLTAAAAGGGWVSGGMLKPGGGEATPDHAPAAGADKAHGKSADDEEMGSHLLAEQLNVFLLEDVTTNLAAPSDTWIRMAVALVFTGAPDPQMAELVHQDFLAYLRTVKAQQIEGPSGFKHLRSDLEERANLRSGGKVKQILIRTLLLE